VGRSVDVVGLKFMLLKLQRGEGGRCDISGIAGVW